MIPLLLVLSLDALTPPAAANEDGITGLSTAGCADCHGKAADPEVTVSLAAKSTTVAGGETLPLTLTVASTDPAHVAAGLDVSASDGLLVAGPTMLWREYELTHQFPHDMQFPQGSTGGAKVFEFSWTAPAYAADVTLYAAGNAVNYDGVEEGDGWGLATLSLTVESDCSDADGDHVGDCEGDCDDSDPDAYPGAEETWYDGVDSDCAGDDDYDADGDGVPVDSDCDDDDPDRSAPEDCEDGDGGASETGAPTGDGGGSDGGSTQADPSDSKGCSASALAPALLLALLPLAALRRRTAS